MRSADTAPVLAKTRRPGGGVIKRGESLVGIEVKWTRKVSDRDLAGLRSFRGYLGDRLRMSVLLYPGDTVVALDDRTVAIPMSVFFGVAH